MPNRRSNGEGTIRQRADGRWEARFSAGVNQGTGKAIRKSIYADTRAEAVKKLREACKAVDDGVYIEPEKLALGQWLDTWINEYSGGLKPRTVDLYLMHIRLNIKPHIGAVSLSKLTTHMIQNVYNNLQRRAKPLSAKSIKNVHGVLHTALDKAVKLGYIRSNPSDAITLPRLERKEMHVIKDEALSRFLQAVVGHKYELMFLIAAFTGMRMGELLGLQWSRVNLNRPTLTIDKQLQKARKKGGESSLVPTKTDHSRTVTPSQYVVDLLREQKRRQDDWRKNAGPEWNNEHDMVFTTELGGFISAVTISCAFKKFVRELGMGELRFHDLRHTFATLSLQNGDDYKTVQMALGHTTPMTTLNTYAHVTQEMQRASADRMDALIKAVKGQN